VKRISRRTKLFAPAVIGAAVAFAQPSFADTDATETAEAAAAPEQTVEATEHAKAQEPKTFWQRIVHAAAQTSQQLSEEVTADSQSADTDQAKDKEDTQYEL